MSREREYQIIEKTRATNEPTFTVRAQDVYSIVAIENYLQAIEYDGNITPEFLTEIRQIHHAFMVWQRENPDKVKTPDL